MADSDIGHYTGKLVLAPLKDGRLMETVMDFGFMEADGLHWPVPRGTTVDGASIPRPLWSLIGGPFDGKYRDASVVHDYYCSVRSYDWRAVHRMFYRAMLVSEVPKLKAKLMYAAVYFAGPKWTEQDILTVTLGPPAVPSRQSPDQGKLFYLRHDPMTLAFSEMMKCQGMSAAECMGRASSVDENSNIVLDLESLSEFLRVNDVSLDVLETAMVKALSLFPEARSAKREISVGSKLSLLF